MRETLAMTLNESELADAYAETVAIEGEEIGIKIRVAQAKS